MGCKGPTNTLNQMGQLFWTSECTPPHLAIPPPTNQGNILRNCFVLIQQSAKKQKQTCAHGSPCGCHVIFWIYFKISMLTSYIVVLYERFPPPPPALPLQPSQGLWLCSQAWWWFGLKCLKCNFINSTSLWLLLGAWKVINCQVIQWWQSSFMIFFGSPLIILAVTASIFLL